MVVASIDNIIEQRLTDYPRRKELDKLVLRLDRLEKENRLLRQNTLEFKREIYSIKDLAKLTNLEPSTIRKNYIATGKIKATRGAKGLEITRDEYFRVMNIVKTRGCSWL